MTEPKKTEIISVPVSPEEYEQLTEEAEAYGVRGRAPLLRLLAERVRDLGGGNVVDGLARLRMAQKEDVLYFADDGNRSSSEDHTAFSDEVDDSDTFSADREDSLPG